VRVKYDAQMRHGQNGVSQKRKLSKKCKLNEKVGKFKSFAKMGRKFNGLGNRVECAMCIIGLWVRDALVKVSLTYFQSKNWETG